MLHDGGGGVSGAASECGRARGAGGARSGVRHALEAFAVHRTLLELKLRRALTDKPMFAFRNDPVAISMVGSYYYIYISTAGNAVPGRSIDHTVIYSSTYLSR